MKFKLLFFIFLQTTLFAQVQSSVPSSEAPWILQRSNFYFENDVFLHRDSQYTSGWKFSNVYNLPKHSTLVEPHFVSIGIIQQIFTPQDLNATKIVVDDRPYASWLYLDVGYHKSSEKSLDSFTLQLGIVGKLSGGQLIQKGFHRISDSDTPNGWDNQLNNELGINLIYQHKWRYIPDNIFGIKSSLIPFTTLGIGNVKTYANAGLLMRIGVNPIQDYGSSSIDIGGENGIPVHLNCLCKKDEKWTYTLNASAKTEAVLHNIFLDGNSFSQSHSVDKESLLFYYSFGFTVRYKRLSLDYILNTSSRQFKRADSSYKFGTIVFSYLY